MRTVKFECKSNIIRRFEDWEKLYLMSRFKVRTLKRDCIEQNIRKYSFINKQFCYVILSMIAHRMILHGIFLQVISTVDYTKQKIIYLISNNPFAWMTW